MQFRWKPTGQPEGQLRLFLRASRRRKLLPANGLTRTVGHRDNAIRCNVPLCSARGEGLSVAVVETKFNYESSFWRCAIGNDCHTGESRWNLCIRRLIILIYSTTAAAINMVNTRHKTPRYGTQKPGILADFGVRALPRINWSPRARRIQMRAAIETATKGSNFQLSLSGTSPLRYLASPCDYMSL